MEITALVSPSIMWVKVGRQGRVYFRSVGRTDCNFPLGFLFFFEQDDASRESQAIMQIKEITAEYIKHEFLYTTPIMNVTGLGL